MLCFREIPHLLSIFYSWIKYAVFDLKVILVICLMFSINFCPQVTLWKESVDGQWACISDVNKGQGGVSSITDNQQNEQWSSISPISKRVGPQINPQRLFLKRLSASRPQISRLLNQDEILDVRILGCFQTGRLCRFVKFVKIFLNIINMLRVKSWKCEYLVNID